MVATACCRPLTFPLPLTRSSRPRSSRLVLREILRRVYSVMERKLPSQREGNRVAVIGLGEWLYFAYNCRPLSLSSSLIAYIT